MTYFVKEFLCPLCSGFLEISFDLLSSLGFILSFFKFNLDAPFFISLGSSGESKVLILGGEDFFLAIISYQDHFIQIVLFNSNNL